MVHFWHSCPLWHGHLALDNGHHGHSDQSATTQPHTQQTMMHCVFWHISSMTSIMLFSSLSYSSTSLWSDQRVFDLLAKTCLFGDALTQSSSHHYLSVTQIFSPAHFQEFKNWLFTYCLLYSIPPLVSCHCNDGITVIHFICLWFQWCGWSV